VPATAFPRLRGEGVFHIGFESDVDDAAAAAAGLGLNVLARGQRDNGSGFIYFDTADDAGVVLLARKTAR
jgi:methylmalonyl-CoA/ethylmalonyl-CoA epimerase